VNELVIAQAKKLALNLDIQGDTNELIDTLKATAFKIKDGVVSDAQMTALMIVAQQYGLNPWVKQIYAVVGVDGWLSIINKHPQYDGVEFNYADELITPDGGKPCPIWCEVKIYRKDLTRPIIVREYLDEVYRPAFEGFNKDTKQKFAINSAWQSHTKRFLRHKTLIQGARIAFGFSGIYDEDEAENLIPSEKIINSIPGEETLFQKTLKAIETMGVDDFKTIDAKSFSEQEKNIIKQACKDRKKSILESSVVATQEKQETQADVSPFLELITNAGSMKELRAIVESMTNDDISNTIEMIKDPVTLERLYNAIQVDRKAEFKDAIDMSLDFLRGAT
jgi:phage recombination protein Bet